MLSNQDEGRRSFAAALLDQVSELLLVTDAHRRIVFTSGRIETMLGYTARHCRHRDILNFVHPDDGDPVAAVVADLVSRPGARGDFQFRLRHVDGTWRQVAATGSNHLRVPPIDGVLICARDITEFRHAEARARDLAAIASSVDDAIFSCDAHGVVDTWNPAAGRMFDVASEDAIGQPLFDVMRGPARLDVVALVIAVFNDERTSSVFTEHTRPNGTSVGMSVTAAPVHDDFGEIIGVGLVARR